jgi:hypothetical protein
MRMCRQISRASYGQERRGSLVGTVLNKTQVACARVPFSSCKRYEKALHALVGCEDQSKQSTAYRMCGVTACGADTSPPESAPSRAVASACRS